jgi:hypothetical protein
MDTNEILNLLEGHRDRLVVAIKALTGEASNGTARKTSRTRKFSAATRRRMSLAMKKRWRERKRAA